VKAAYNQSHITPFTIWNGGKQIKFFEGENGIGAIELLGFSFLLYFFHSFYLF